MVTFAQAQERAEHWVNGELPAYQHREVRVREFDLGFVAWAEDREDGPTSDGGRARLVIARDSGDVTLWPGLPVGEVIRRYEEEYGARPEEADPDGGQEPPPRVDLEATSFLLTPPQWLQDAADQIGIPDRRQGAGPAGRSGAGAGTGSVSSSGATASAPGGPAGSPVSAPAGGSGAWPDARGSGSAGAFPGGPGDREPTARDGVPSSAPGSGAGPAAPAASGGSGGPAVPSEGTPWAGTDTAGAGDEGSVDLPATVFAPPLVGADDEDDGGGTRSGVSADAKTELMSGGSSLPRTRLSPALDAPGPDQGSAPGAPAAPGAPGPQGAPGPPAAAG
ncbi:hypothetical protein [Streptomyces sp. NPDC048845]|uniref:hypothetical protein n=1 Tax=Streptomyces sp. NPDC048845 TaxID=3155390 RepID=UPI0034210601